jgi:hypothetical protein
MKAAGSGVKRGDDGDDGDEHVCGLRRRVRASC